MSNGGKDDLINILAENRFSTNYKLTVGVGILSKDIEYKSGEVATLSIWDIGGQQRFEFIRPTFYKGAAGALLTFDLTREQTLSEIRKWLKEIFQYTGRIPFLLIGNNIRLDKDSLTNREKIYNLVKSQGGIYLETNPENINSINKALYGLIDQILLMRTQRYK